VPGPLRPQSVAQVSSIRVIRGGLRASPDPRPAAGSCRGSLARSISAMERPTKFEHHRWVGDKRTRIVYDVDNLTDGSIIDELLAAETFLCFGPDTLAEARNRGYRPYKGTGAG
jgi:hypothetical protein